MVASLKPLDLSGYIAGNSLAARLIAQAGESTGQGYAGLGQGLASGITQAVQRKDRQKELDRQQANFNATRADRLAENARDDARYEAEVKIRAAERNQAMAEVRMAKIAQERNNRLTLDPNADVSDLDAQAKQIETAHATMDNIKMGAVQALIAPAAAPGAECPPGGT